MNSVMIKAVAVVASGGGTVADLPSAVAREIASELDQIERQITELHADAEAIRFHRATLRLARMAWLARSIAAGLRQQASKVEAREK